MHVGIDITSLMYGRGVSRYTANLVKSLIEHTNVRLSLYGSSLRQKQQLKHEVSKILKVVSPTTNRVDLQLQSYPPALQNILWNYLGRNAISDILPQIEVFHSWDWLQPPDKDLPLVSTIHDLAILKFPETAHPRVLSMHQQSWKTLKERQAHIIAISRSTKNDIIEWLKFPGDHVHVIYEALPNEFLQVSQNLNEVQYDQLKQQLHLDRPFILFVGTREPRKNLLRLITAWESLSSEFDLIIAGESGWDETSQITSRLDQPHLRFLGKVTDQQLAVLYSEAAVFAYPSLYEGFGLPILESFYYGTPVVCSDIAAMKEVAGNAAAVCDPFSVESLRASLIEVLHESLPEQQKRLQRMIIRLQMFDWHRVARETLQVYQKAVEDKK